MTVKRYGCANIYECPDTGQHVDYADYAALQAENERLQEAVRVGKAWEVECHQRWQDAEGVARRYRDELATMKEENGRLKGQISTELLRQLAAGRELLLAKRENERLRAELSAEQEKTATLEQLHREDHDWRVRATESLAVVVEEIRYAYRRGLHNMEWDCAKSPLALRIAELLAPQAGEPVPPVAPGVPVDFTGLPLEPFEPRSWQAGEKGEADGH